MSSIVPQLAFNFDPILRFCKSCSLSKPPEYFDCPLGRCRACDKKSLSERQARYRESHRKEMQALRKVRYDTDPRYGPEKQREWRLAHPEASRAATKRHRKKNPYINRICVNNRRARILNCEGTHTAQEWEAVKSRFNYRCLRCGRQEPEIKLTIDHVIPLTKGGRNDVSNLQPLCQPCNSTKHATTLDLRGQSNA